MRRDHLIRGLAILGGYLVNPGLVKAADCLRDSRRVPVGEQGRASTVRLRQYLCDHPKTGAISVQFSRLNDLAASLFIEGQHSFGKELEGVKVVENAILSEYRKLLKHFGENNDEQVSISASITDPNQGSGTLDLQSIARVPMVTSARIDYAKVDFPDPQALDSLIDNRTIPSRYTSGKSSNDHEAIIWRYMDSKDISDYPRLVHRYNELVRGNRFDVSLRGQPAAKQFSGFTTGNIPRNIRLYRYLTQSSDLPSDFIVIVGQRDVEPSCGYRKFWEFGYYPRELVLDFAIIQNRGQQTAVIDMLIGATSSGALRPISSGLPQPAEREAAILSPSLRLAPGERAAIPLRLTWLVSGLQRSAFADEEKKLPKGDAYMWGPEIRMAGFRVNGQALLLEGSAANFFSVTTSCSCGSCPYLHAWNSSLRTWENSGKIIDKAQGAALLQSESRSFTGYVPRFKLSEDEPELAHIKDVALELQLHSGARVMALSTRASHDFELSMGESMELRFKLPRNIRGKDVACSTLTITGYYDRYSDILSEKFGAPHSLSGPHTHDVTHQNPEAGRRGT